MDVKKYLATQQASSCSNTDSVLELLYNTYYEHVCSDDTDEIKQAFDDLYNALPDKSLREKDVIIDLVCNLCRLHQQSGFINGLKIATRLSYELNN